MNISIGQYIPGNSILHKADPRTKLCLIVLYMVLVITINSYIGYLIAAVYLLISILIGKISVKLLLGSLKAVLFVIMFTAILNLFFVKGTDPLFQWKFIEIYKEGISISLKMTIRIILLVSCASLLTFTTTPILLTDGLESLMRPLSKLKFPSHEIAMMMTIALRFIPTFVEETDRIIKAQTARGADFDSKNLIEKVKSFIPVLVPLFVGAFRRAEELAIAMEARCYHGGEGRTRLKVLKFTYIDAVLTFVTILFAVVIISIE